jgi:hypothetical protein
LVPPAPSRRQRHPVERLRVCCDSDREPGLDWCRSGPRR